MRIRGDFFALLLLLWSSLLTAGTEVYRFERMWPSLQQPWYFIEPFDLAIDRFGAVYMGDRLGCRVVAFAADGQLITASPGNCSGLAPMQVNRPVGLAFDLDGFLYVADSITGVVKMTPEGVVIKSWGSFFFDTDDPDRMQEPFGIDVSADGFVYVVERLGRVHKFDLEGNRITIWNVPNPGGVPYATAWLGVRNSSNQIFIGESAAGRIYAFESDGTPAAVPSWTEPLGLRALDIDAQDRVAVVTILGAIQYYDPVGNLLGTDIGLQQEIQPTFFSRPVRGIDFTPEGVAVAVAGQDIIRSRGDELLTIWSSGGKGDGFFLGRGTVNVAEGRMDFDSADLLYVPDRVNARIQVFQRDGTFVRKWSTTESVNDEPIAVEVDVNGNIFAVLGQGNGARVSLYSNSGALLAFWDASSPGLDSSFAPRDVASLSDGRFLVLNGDKRVFRFKSDGTFDQLFFDAGSGPGVVNLALAMTADGAGKVYIADINGGTIVVVGSDGVFEKVVPLPANANPSDVQINALGQFVVASRLPDAMVISDQDGNLIQQFGATGSFPGFFDDPKGVAISSDNRIFVFDSNNRIQAFRSIVPVDSTRAIIVAAGGPFPGNVLWPATQLNANFAYRALAFQGFTRDSIQYLSSDTSLDLDQNGIADDVDADATASNLQNAILGPFTDAVDNLLIYLVDHGGSDRFRISASETLDAADLTSWINQWQDSKPGTTVTLIYDACQSGSFVDDLIHPSHQRTVITSADAVQNAYFVSQGALSFSSFFWTEVFNGKTLDQALATADLAVQTAFSGAQVVQVDADGDGLPNQAADITAVTGQLIGVGTVIAGTSPNIGAVVAGVPVGSSASFTVSNVTDSDGISRVWGLVRPPDFNPASPDNPVGELPVFEFSPTGMPGEYSGTFGDFVTEGSYQVSVNALDAAGNTSTAVPVAVNILSPLKRKAIVVAGGDPLDGRFDTYQGNALLAVRALTQQGYGPDGVTCTDHLCDDIRFITEDVLAERDGSGLMAVQDAITVWGTADSRDLTVYLIGDRDATGLRINAADSLSKAQLDSWLDQAELALAPFTGTVTVIIDADDAADLLTADSARISLGSASAGRPARMLSNGAVSFSRFFWTQILNGASVRSAFRTASQAVGFGTNGQLPVLNDNGNGQFNDLLDGLVANRYAIGSGVLLAGDDPVVASVQLDNLIAAPDTVITASGVTSTGTIASVLAIARLSDGTDIALPMAAQGGDVWFTSSNLCSQDEVTIAVFAEDLDGNVSQPGIASFLPDVGCDTLFVNGFE